MRLLSLSIENFGKLSNFQMDFSKNPTIILENNGWGKTTLATFIKVMFYGFAGGQKHGLENNERKRYMPWNKGTFGGSIRFEANGKEYELTRIFGSKEADDSATLRDAVTRLETNDYNRDKLGEELFGIDSRSFVRSVYMGQGNISVRNEKNNIEDGIAAKIGNLTDATDDVNNYEKVTEELKNRLNSLKYGNKKGVINQINERLTELEVSINRKDYTLQAIKDLEAKISEEKESVKKHKEELARLDEEFGKVSLVGEYNARKKALEELAEEVRLCEAKVAEEEKYFGGDIPAEKELDEYFAKIRQIDLLKTVISENTVDEAQIKAKAGSAKNEEIQAAIDNWKKKEQLSYEVRNASLQAESFNQNLEMDKRRREDEWVRIQNEKREAFINNRELRKKQNRIRTLASVMTGVILIIAGLILQYASGENMRQYSIYAYLTGAVVLVFSGVFGLLKRFADGAEAEYVEEPMPEYEPDRSGLERILRSVEEMEHEIYKIKERVRGVFMENGLEYNPDTVEQDLYAFKESLKDAAYIKEKELKCEEAGKQINEIYAYLDEALRQMGVNKTGEYIEVFNGARESLAKIRNQKENHDSLKKKYEEKRLEFNEYDALEIEKLRSAEEITADRDSLDDTIDAQSEVIDAYKRQLEEKIAIMDAIENDEQESIALKEELKEKNHKYDIILQTKDYLDKAKKQLTARYMDPISDAYTKYYSFISTKELDSFEIDANINVTKTEQGMARNVISLSQGSRDLVDIALRMALVDVMYQDESPFIIMDDPFVNLDQDKVECAKEFIKEVAKNYQVIYFTCHSSRM